MDVEKVPLIFIVGHGRSGTTLLQSLLNGHPNIVAPIEYEFIAYFYPRFGKVKHFKKNDINEFIDALFFDAKFSMWLMDREQLTKKLLTLGNNVDYQALCKILISLTGEKKEEIKLLSDKNPINSLFVKKLMKIFPDAKFVHMIRDPRDSVNGHIRRLPQKNPFFLARRWKRYNAIIETYKQKSPNKFFTIKYENMVKDFDKTMVSLSSFLNIPYHDFKKKAVVPEEFNLLEKNKILEALPHEQKKAVTGKLKSFHESLSSPINTDSIYRWKKEMSPYNITATEIITGESAKKYGYEIGAGKKYDIHISKLLLLKSRIIFLGWELYTRWRYNNYKYNTRYRTKFIRDFIKKG